MAAAAVQAAQAAIAAEDMAAAAAAVQAAQAAIDAENIAVDAIKEYFGFVLPQHQVAIKADVRPQQQRHQQRGICPLEQQESAAAAVVASKHENNVLLIPSSQHQRIWTREKSERGRIDSKALQVHYGGEGRKSVRIKEAKV